MDECFEEEGRNRVISRHGRWKKDQRKQAGTITICAPVSSFLEERESAQSGARNASLLFLPAPLSHRCTYEA